MLTTFRPIPSMVCLATAFLVAGCGGDGGTAPTPTTTGVLLGSVIDVDSGSAGLVGVTVRLESAAAGQRTVTTDGAGSFRVGDARAGAWQAEIQVPGTHRLDAGEAGLRSASVVAGATATMQPFRLARPRGSVSGQVLLEGVGTASGSVAARRAGFGNVTATPAAAGDFMLPSLAIGVWTLDYTPGSAHRLGASESGTRSVSVAEGQTTVAAAFEIRPQPVQSGVVEIHLTAGTEFSPSSVTIAPGTTVRWINDTSMDHTITPENTSQQGVWLRRTTSTQGVVFEHTFSDGGQTYRYRCEPHSQGFDSGMVGVIVVT